MPSSLSKNFSLLWLILLFIPTSAKSAEISLSEDIIQIPIANNLLKDGKLQLETGKVILLYVSAPHCAFCKKLEREILLPLLKSGDYEDKIILRKINWTSKTEVTNFFGIKETPRAILKKYGVQITPTLLFLDGKGQEVNERLLGYRGGEFYWFYFDSAIRKSNINIAKQNL